MHLTLAELNGRTLTRHLWFSFRVSKKPFNFFTILSPSMKTVSFEIGDDGVLLTLLSLLLLLLLLFSLLLLLLLLLLFFLSILLYSLDFLPLKVILEPSVLSVATTLPLLFLEDEDLLLEKILLFLLLLPLFLLFLSLLFLLLLLLLLLLLSLSMSLRTLLELLLYC